jgi:hypothetical protein
VGPRADLDFLVKRKYLLPLPIFELFCIQQVTVLVLVNGKLIEGENPSRNPKTDFTVMCIWEAEG